LKLAVNSAINPLTALHQCRNGELLQLPDIAAQVAQLCAELSRVAASAGQALAPATLAAAVFAVIRDTAANRSSMLQDLSQRRRSEIDFINGYIVQCARRAQLACPAHAALWQAVKARERQLGCR
jgi:2-dehydropantoate 2-reductase